MEGVSGQARPAWNEQEIWESLRSLAPGAWSTGTGPGRFRPFLPGAPATFTIPSFSV
jgi:hypothetical protein